jgi:hypothetical protein
MFKRRLSRWFVLVLEVSATGRSRPREAGAALVPLALTLLLVVALLYASRDEPELANHFIGAGNSTREAVGLAAFVGVGLLAAYALLPLVLRTLRGGVRIRRLLRRHVARRDQLGRDVRPRTGALIWDADGHAFGEALLDQRRIVLDDADLGIFFWFCNRFVEQVRRMQPHAPRTAIDHDDIREAWFLTFEQLEETIGPNDPRHRVLKALDRSRDAAMALLRDGPAPFGSDRGVLRYLYPRQGQPLPTLLGNVGEAARERISDRHGIDVTVLWPSIAALVGPAEAEALERARRSADTLTAATAGWLMSVVAVVPVLEADTLALLAIPAIAALLTRMTYGEAIAAELCYWRLVEGSVDLQRLRLVDALGYRRPSSADEEREMFRRLSAAAGETTAPGLELASTLGHPAADELVKELRRNLADVLEDVPARLWRQIDGTVTSVVRDTVDRAVGPAVSQSFERTLHGELKATVTPALRDEVRDLFRGPRLVNYDGAVYAALFQDGKPVRPRKDGRVVIDPQRRHWVTVNIGPANGDTWVTSAPLQISSGDDAAEVVFDITVEGDEAPWQLEQKTVTVRGDELNGDRFELPSREFEGRAWIWIRVAQQGRTIQNLELPVEAAHAA